MKSFIFLPHTADIKMRAYGTTQQELFKHALIGMFSISKPVTACGAVDFKSVLACSLTEQQPFAISSPTAAFLLIDFLSEALYFSDAYNHVLLDVNFTVLTETTAQGTFLGLPIIRLHGVEVKAVTYHTTALVYKNGLWHADIVFDI